MAPLLPAHGLPCDPSSHQSSVVFPSFSFAPGYKLCILTLSGPGFAAQMPMSLGGEAPTQSALGAKPSESEPGHQWGLWGWRRGCPSLRGAGGQPGHPTSQAEPRLPGCVPALSSVPGARGWRGRGWPLQHKVLPEHPSCKPRCFQPRAAALSLGQPHRLLWVQ